MAIIVLFYICSMKKYFYSILIILIFIGTLNASENLQGLEDYNKLKADSAKKVWIVKGFLHDEGKLWASPLGYSKKNYCIALPVIGATALAIIYDEKIQSNLQDLVHRNKGIKNAGAFITNGGGDMFGLATCGLLYFGGLVFRDDKARQTGFLAAYALAHTAVIIEVGKFMSGRQRPYSGKGKDEWHWFTDYFKHSNTIGDGYHSSFPSGHAALAWTLASVISTEYSDNKLVAPIAYTFATAVSISRLTEYKHWASDAIIGSVIGYGIGKFAVNHRKNTKWTLLPTYYNNSVILSANYKF